MMNGTLVLSFGLVLLMGSPPAATPTMAPKAVTARIVNADLLAWLDPDRGGLEQGSLTARLENHGAETLTLAPSGAEVTRGADLLRTCTVYTATARGEGEKIPPRLFYDYVLKPKQVLEVRMVFRCPAVGGKRLTVDRRKTYGVALTLSWATGRVRVAADKVTPMLHPGVDGGF